MYIMYLIEHKKNVFKTCWKRKLYKHAITHDLSKLSSSEFFPYAKYFYLSKDEFKKEFEKAWEHHYKNNPHHWQYWLAPNGEPQPMSKEAIEQMIADWEGMAIELGDTAQEYYLKYHNQMQLSPDTRLYIEHRLSLPEIIE